MIYDHIKNIGLYKGISPALDTALEFIAGARLPMDNGTTLLPHGVKAIVSEYVTRPVPELVEGPAEVTGGASVGEPAGPPKQYEAHLKYADVQFLLAGSEHLRCCPLEYLAPATDYDEAGDCRFYVDQPGSGVALRLGSGYFAVVFPDDAHIPQLAVGEPEEVKKVVVKVPVGRKEIES